MTNESPASESDTHLDPSEVAARFEGIDTDSAVDLARSLHPADLAGALAALDGKSRASLLSQLHADELATIVNYLEPRYRPIVYEDRSASELTEVAAALPDDLATDMIQSLPPEVGEEVVGEGRPVRPLGGDFGPHARIP